MQFLRAELAKEQMLKQFDKGADYCAWELYNYGDAAQKLISLLEQEEAKEENVKCS